MKQSRVNRDRRRDHDKIHGLDRFRKKRKREHLQIVDGSNDEVLDFEVRDLLAQTSSSRASKHDTSQNLSAKEVWKRNQGLSPLPREELELKVVKLSSTGDGLALSTEGDHAYIVPFSLPGDIILAKPMPRIRGPLYSIADFVKVVEPAPDRDSTNIKCKYFQQCSGCQLQMLPYEKQLAHKRTVIERAYRDFSGLDPVVIPSVEETIGSPLQYGYRTKITPHFDGADSVGGPGTERKFTSVPAIGFSMKGRKKVVDIESCPLATDILNEGLFRERQRVVREIGTYKNGATLLIREHTKRFAQTPSPSLPANTTDEPRAAIIDPEGRSIIRSSLPTFIEEKSYRTNMNDNTQEWVDNWKFTTRAGSFFQNNNSILPTFTSYIREHAIPPVAAGSAASEQPQIKYLLDAYCGSGLFAITLSSLFKSALGIDIDSCGIEAARLNARDNDLQNIGFIEADASALFADVPFPCDETLVVIDPPKKGASQDFIEQLMKFGPKRVIYVSCNVHSQARDVGMLARGNGRWRYEIKGLRGFDFFPQTAHVEGVAFLDRAAV